MLEAEIPMLDEHDGTTEQLLSAAGLADFLSVSVSTVRRMTRDGQLPVVRVRTAVRYDPEAVVRWLTDDCDDDCSCREHRTP